MGSDPILGLGSVLYVHEVKVKAVCIGSHLTGPPRSGKVEKGAGRALRQTRQWAVGSDPILGIHTTSLGLVHQIKVKVKVGGLI